MYIANNCKRIFKMIYEYKYMYEVNDIYFRSLVFNRTFTPPIKNILFFLTLSN